MNSKLPMTVFALGFVSFLTDFSSEMIYPLLPAFLASEFGATALALGIIEGVAEATASVLKLVSGIWSDRSPRKKPFVLIGYGVSGAMRPLVGLATTWWFVLVIRFMDRVGKGIRTSPRDALISNIVAEGARGRAFGVQRAMDHAGAVVGPLVATGLLLIPGMTVREVFLWAAVPAALAFFAIIFLVEEKATESIETVVEGGFKMNWSLVTPEFKKFLVAMFVFTLGCSTDAFLLLRLNQAGVPASAIAFLWSAHHVVKALSSSIGGAWSDKFGDRKIMIAGWVFYAFIYLAFSFDLGATTFAALFLLYGVYYGLTEPSERSFVSKLAARGSQGTAFGYFHLMVGVASLPASVLFGWVWQSMGAGAAFRMGALFALIACGLLVSIRFDRETLSKT